MNITQTTTPQIFIIGNAASGVEASFAPGEIITIKGSQLLDPRLQFSLRLVRSRSPRWAASA